MFERLESRRLLSVTLYNGVLTIVGTPQSERWDINDPHFDNTASTQLQVFYNDTLVESFDPAEVQRVVVDLGAGNDLADLWPLSIPALLLGGAGHDVLHAGGAQDTIVGGRGNDSITAQWSGAAGFVPATLIQVVAGLGNDEISGLQDLPIDVDADARLIAFGGAGNDLIGSSQSIDRISGGEGDDTVLANPGNDRIDGNAGNDYLIGDFGNDRITGGDGDDRIYGGEGNDTIDGGAGRDKIIGHNGDDVIFARDNQRDTIHGDAGDNLAAFDEIDLVGEIETVL